MPSGRVLATQQARDAAKQLHATTGRVKEQIGKVLQQGGVLADPANWDGSHAGQWRSTWGLDAGQLNRAIAKLDDLERKAQQVIEDILRAGDEGSIAGAPLTGAGAGGGKPNPSIGENIMKDLEDPVKDSLNAAGFATDGVVGGLVAAKVGALKGEAGRLMGESELAAQRYLNSPGGSAEARFQNARAYQKFLDADALTRRAGSIGRSVGSKLPIVGLAITAGGIGYDISQGKPAGQAVASGVGGALAAAGTGALVGTAIGGPVGTVVGAGVGIVAGMITSGVIDWGYGELPEGVRNGIEDGMNAIGDAGEAIGSGVKKVWDSIF